MSMDFDEIAVMICDHVYVDNDGVAGISSAAEAIVAALRAAPARCDAQSARVPKVRTSHHRNKEEAARLQALVAERYAREAVPFLCPRCGARGTTDGKASTISSARREMFKCNCPHEVRGGCSEPKCPHYTPPITSTMLKSGD